jgi:putative ABC transport system permease protein
MNFVIKMAWREIRSSWQRLLFFFVCIAIGVGSIVALRSVIQSVRVALASEARTLLGADLARRARHASFRGGRDSHDGASGRRVEGSHAHGRAARRGT